LAVDEEGRMLGCGQIKPHKGSIRELASIAVVPEARGLGLARAIIVHLMQTEKPPLYLTCQPTLLALYRRFGFHMLELAEYPAYFRRLDRLARFLLSFRGDHESFSLMRWDGEKNDQ